MLGISFTSYNGLGLALTMESGKTYQANYLAVGSYAMVIGIASISVFVAFSNPKLKAGAIVCASLAMFALYRSGARGQAIAFLLGAMMVYYGLHAWLLQKPMSKSLIGILITVAICLAVASQFSDDLSAQRSRWTASALVESNAKSSGLADRFYMAQRLLSEFVQSNAYLIGLGSSSSFEIMNTYCHIVPVEVLCELGLLGMTMYIIVLTTIYQTARRVIFEQSIPTNLRYIQITFAAVYFSMFVTQLKQGAVTGLCISMSVATAMAATESLAIRAVSEQRRSGSARVAGFQNPGLLSRV